MWDYEGGVMRSLADILNIIWSMRVYASRTGIGSASDKLVSTETATDPRPTYLDGGNGAVFNLRAFFLPLNQLHRRVFADTEMV